MNYTTFVKLYGWNDMFEKQKKQKNHSTEIK